MAGAARKKSFKAAAVNATTDECLAQSTRESSIILEAMERRGHITGPDVIDAISDACRRTAYYWRKEAGTNPTDSQVKHPFLAAKYAAQMGLDADAIIATLAHNLPMDSRAMGQRYGRSTATRVKALEGVARKGPYHSGPLFTSQSPDAFCQLLLQRTPDPQLLKIVLADQMAHMDDLSTISQNPEDQRRFAQQVLDTYAPLAHRLGIGFASSHLEDKAFAILDPQAHSVAQQMILAVEGGASKTTTDLITAIRDALHNKGLPAEVSHRVKSVYSLAKKIKAGRSLDDILGLRIIVGTDDPQDCYKAAQIVAEVADRELRKNYVASLQGAQGKDISTENENVIQLNAAASSGKEAPGAIQISKWPPSKDYIATPKENGYSGIHGFINVTPNCKIEVQIRTPSMDSTANFGPAAHAGYKTGGSLGPLEPFFQKIRALAKKARKAGASNDDLHRGILDLLSNTDNCVFSENGKEIWLPPSATVFDTVVALNPDNALLASGAERFNPVNGKWVPVRLQDPVGAGDFIRVVTDGPPHADLQNLPRNTPSTREWLATLETRAVERLAWPQTDTTRSTLIRVTGYLYSANSRRSPARPPRLVVSHLTPKHPK
jgi:GTP diphosphokinase / guanosine-3',5'-bis(diphosphate) 3'-diphosphatase